MNGVLIELKARNTHYPLYISSLLAPIYPTSIFGILHVGSTFCGQAKAYLNQTSEQKLGKIGLVSLNKLRQAYQYGMLPPASNQCCLKQLCCYLFDADDGLRDTYKSCSCPFPRKPLFFVKLISRKIQNKLSLQHQGCLSILLSNPSFGYI